jgi:phosphoglycolate phosphatase-like HAD superfamily hydrolase
VATLYLDLDGTLIDVRRRHHAAYTAAARAVGVEPLAERAAWTRRRAGASAADLVDPALRERFRRDWLARIEAPDLLRMDAPLPGAIAALAELRESHGLVLVTLRHDRDALERQLGWLGLSEYLSSMQTPTTQAPTKAALIRAAGPAADGIVVGDTEADVEAARELGLTSVCVVTGLRSRRFLQELEPDYVLEDFAALPALVAGLRPLARNLA